MCNTHQLVVLDYEAYRRDSAILFVLTMLLGEMLENKDLMYFVVI